MKTLFTTVMIVITAIFMPLSSSRNYLVEFRAIRPQFRVMKLQQAMDAIMTNRPTFYDDNNHYIINHDPIYNISQRYMPWGTLSDPIVVDNDDSPICMYVELPNDDTAKAVANRCCLIRSIIEVWANGCNVSAAAYSAPINPSLLDDHFSPLLPSEDKTWRATFRRLGRSKSADFKEREALLQQFEPLLRRLGGPVDLQHPRHELVYLEDWTSFQQHHNEITKIKPSTILSSDISERSVIQFQPSQVFLGRLVGSGDGIQTMFDIKQRPYLGSTTMDEISSHLTAVAARVRSGDLVLDPFCGTGSLLVACAHLGAVVVGSDVDADSLGLASLSSFRSKNRRFRRLNDDLTQGQVTGCAMDNFIHYSLDEYVLAWIALDAADWADDKDIDSHLIYINPNVVGDKYPSVSEASTSDINLSAFPKVSDVSTNNL